MAQRATQSIVVAAAPDTIYDVVVDFARYREWVSDVKSIDVLARDDLGRALEVAFRAAAFGRSTSYALRYDYSQAPQALSWHQTYGDVTEVLNGHYDFALVSLEPLATRVTYDLEVELAVPVPHFIHQRAAARIQRHALVELKRRSEALS